MTSCACNLDLSVVASFADLVVLAGEFHPIPFRTRPLKPPAPMVLRPKPRESRSLPGQQRTRKRNSAFTIRRMTRRLRQHDAESPDTFERLFGTSSHSSTDPKEREFPSLGRFKDGGKFDHTSDATRCRMKIGGQRQGRIRRLSRSTQRSSLGSVFAMRGSSSRPNCIIGRIP